MGTFLQIVVLQDEAFSVTFFSNDITYGDQKLIGCDHTLYKFCEIAVVPISVYTQKSNQYQNTLSTPDLISDRPYSKLGVICVVHNLTLPCSCGDEMTFPF